MELEDMPMIFFDCISPTDDNTRIQKEKKIGNQKSYEWSASGFSLGTIMLYPIHER